MQNFIFCRPAIYLLLLILFSQTVCAQYKGGSDDGVSAFAVVNQQLGQNIYKGGIDDGNCFSFSGNQPLGQNIYLGGPDDGHSTVAILNQPLGQNIYFGGIDDGHAMFPALIQPLGQNIYSGGVDDGITSLPAANQALGQNIFLGGADDGWAFAMGTNLMLVPITLRSFDASWKNDEDVLARWVTSMEANTGHFELQLGIDGTSFETVGNIPAAGNSSTDRTYSFVDVRVNNHYNSRPALFYYRLKTVDKDGHITYSAIVVLKNSTTVTSESITVYPNPATQYITLEFKNGAASFVPRTIQIFSSDGKMISQKNITDPKEMLQVSNYPSGIYYLKVIEPVTKNIQTIKFIIQH